VSGNSHLSSDESINRMGCKIQSNGKRIDELTGLPLLSVFSVVFAMLMLGFVPGCQKQEPEAVQTSNESTEPPKAEEQAEPSEWVGRWLLVITEQQTDFHPMLIEIAEMEDQRALRVLEYGPMKEFEAWKLKGIGFQENQIKIGFEAGETRLIFSGTLSGDAVLGCLYPEEQMTPTQARLEKTSITNFRKFETPVAAAGAELYQKALREPPESDALETFITENPNSPLTVDAAQNSLSRAVLNNQPLEEMEKTVERVAATVKRWGVEMLPDALLDVIQRLDFKPTYRPLIAKFLEELKTTLGEEAEPIQKIRLQKYSGMYLITSADPAEQAEGKQKLEELLTDQPFDFQAILALASHAEEQKKPDQALELYARLTVLPGMAGSVGEFPDPLTGEPIVISKKTRSLFEGDDQAYELFLDETYEKEAFYFKKPRTEPPALPENRRVPILELFTGARCPPCVAADLAVGGVEQSFPAPEVIALRYHQHIPGPDPLANLASESRMSYYGSRGTPALYLNGRSVEGAGGYVIHAANLYENLLGNVSSLLGQTSPVQIDLQTAWEGDKLTITAKTTGVSQERKTVRMRVVLVEPLVPYVAPNGIRLHEMVVRDLPGGAAGVAIPEKAELTASLSIAELKAKLSQESELFEENRQFKFDHVPLDLQEVRVVAYVQDDDTRQILQATISPVLTVPGTPAKPAADPAAEKTTPATPAAETPDSSPENAKPAEPPAEKPAAEPSVPEKNAPTESPAAETTPPSEPATPESKPDSETP